MALTAAQEQKLLKDVDLLSKRFLEGRAATSINKAYFEEAFLSSQTVLPSQILANEDLIPQTAAEVEDIVELNTDLVMNHIEGTDSFHHPDLEGSLRFNFGDGTSYLQTLKKDDNSEIPFGQNDWHFDPSSGVVYFMNGLPDGVTALLPPKITAYKYIGETFQSAKKSESYDSVLSIETDPVATEAGASYGDRFLIGTGATGIWSGNIGKIASMRTVNFVYTTPEDGGSVKVDDDDGRIYHHNGDWDNTFRWIRYSFSSIRVASTVGTNAYTASVTPPLESLEEDHVLLTLVANTNTGPCTIDTGFGVIDIKKYNPAGAKIALVAGDYLGGTIPFLFYDSVDYVLFSGAATGGGDDDWGFVSGSTSSDPIYHDGNVNIGVNTDNNSLLYVEGGNADEFPVYVQSDYTGGNDHTTIFGTATGSNAGVNVGIEGRGQNDTGDAVGVGGSSGGTKTWDVIMATNSLAAAGAAFSVNDSVGAGDRAVVAIHAAVNIATDVYGLDMIISNAHVSGDGFLFRLQDGTQASGKWIKSIDNNGVAQWAFIVASDITSGTFLDGRISQSSVTQHEGAINHDATTNYAIGQHRVINDSGTSTTELLSADKITSLVSAVSAGIDIKDPVETSTEGLGNITLSGEQTLNNVLTSVSRVLVTEQTQGEDNGIYVTAAGVWSRSADADQDAEVTNGMTLFVSDATSTVYRHRYLLTTADPIVVGTTPLTFAVIPALEFGTTAGTAAEGNDSRILSQDENDAALGTNGTPSTSNRYVTNSDSRNTDSRDPNTHASDHTDGTDDIQLATTTQKGLVEELATTVEIDAGTDGSRVITPLSLKDSSPTIKATNISELVDLYVISVSAIDGNLTVGTVKDSITIRYAGTIIEVSGDVADVPTGASIIYDLNINGSTTMATNKIEIDISTDDSKDAGTQPTLTNTAVALGDKLTPDIDQIGSTISGAGGKVYIHIKRT